MSYRWGLNGNDLNWDALVQNGQVKEQCIECKENMKELRLEKGRSLTDEEMENFACEGHTTKYSARGWALYHDTNGNFVSAVGNVPLDVYNNEYLIDWISDGDNVTKNQIKRIWHELTDRMIEDQYNSMEVIGYWGISNTGSLNVYKADDSDAWLVGINNFTPEWCEIKTEPVTDDNKDYAGEDEEHLQYIVLGKSKSKWYLNQCMRVRV